MLHVMVDPVSRRILETAVKKDPSLEISAYSDGEDIWYVIVDPN
jgi:hypothetical protein